MSLLQTLGERDPAMDGSDIGLSTPTSGTMDASSKSFSASPPSASLVPPTDEERNAAKEATRKFFVREFSEVRELVTRLTESRPNDPKVAVNSVVAKFSERGCGNAQNFVNELAESCEKLNVTLTVPESLEDIDYAAFYLNKALVSFHLRQYRAAIKILRKLFQYIEPLDDRLIVKVCLLLVECYLALQQPENALFVLNHAESHLLDKNCSASLHQSSPVASTPVNNKPSSATAASSSSSSSSPEKDMTVSSAGGMGKVHGRSVELVLTDNQKQKFQEYRIRAYLMARNLKACKKEAKGFLHSTCSGPTAVIQPFLRANVEYLKGNSRKAVHFLNLVSPAAIEEAMRFLASSDSSGHFPFYVGGTFTSDDELEKGRSMEPVLPEGPWSEPVGPAYYNNLGCIHFHMGRLNLSCHYFAMASKEHDRVVAARHKAFYPFLDKAESKSGQKKNKEEDDEEEAEGILTEQWPIWAQGCGRRYEVAYNLGVALLHAGKPDQAFDHLWTAAKAYPSNPLLWHRLAEACIMQYRADNEPDFHFQDRKKSLVQGSIGHPAHRKLILPTKLAECGLARSCDSTSSPSNKPVARLEFAELCLRNALAILDRREDARSAAHSMAPFSATTGCAGVGVKVDGVTAAGRKEQEKADDPDVNPLLKPRSVECLPGATLKPREAFNLRCSVLVASAYVSLRLFDSKTAFARTRDLLSCEPYLSPTHRLLAHSYRAEALVMDDRISEAIRHLVADEVVGTEFGAHIQGLSPFDDELDASSSISNNHTNHNNHTQQQTSVSQCSKHVRRWFPNNASTAKVVVQYNLTVAYAFRGELEKAGDALKQLSKFKEPNTEIPIQAMLLALYIQVQLGNVDIARKIIKQHCPQYR